MQTEKDKNFNTTQTNIANKENNAHLFHKEKDIKKPLKSPNLTYKSDRERVSKILNSPLTPLFFFYTLLLVAVFFNDFLVTYLTLTFSLILFSAIFHQFISLLIKFKEKKNSNTLSKKINSSMIDFTNIKSKD